MHINIYKYISVSMCVCANVPIRAKSLENACQSHALHRIIHVVEILFASLFYYALHCILQIYFQIKITQRRINVQHFLFFTFQIHLLPIVCFTYNLEICSFILFSFIEKTLSDLQIISFYFFFFF